LGEGGGVGLLQRGGITQSWGEFLGMGVTQLAGLSFRSDGDKGRGVFTNFQVEGEFRNEWQSSEISMG